MPTTFTDVVAQVINGILTAKPGTWIQLRHNISGALYTSSGAADLYGVVPFTNVNVPAGVYTVRSGLASGGPFTDTTETGYIVPISAPSAVQAITEAVLTSGLDASISEVVTVTLTANRVVGLPINPAIGQRLELIFTQDGVGNRTLAWPSGIKTAWQPTLIPGSTSSLTIRYYGTNWQQVGGQVAVSDAGVLVHQGPMVIRGPRPFVDVRAFGAKCDCNIGGLGSITNGQTTFTMIPANEGISFVATDVGKLFVVWGAGVAGADLRTTIASFIDAAHVTLAAAASTTVVNVPWYYSSDDTVAIQAAIDFFGVNAYNSQGGVVKQTGLSGISGQVVVRARVAYEGVGRDVSGVVAMTGFPASTPLVWLGTQANILSFGSRCENMRVDCNNFTGSIGVYSERMNEQSGIFRVLVINWLDKAVKVAPPGVGAGAQNYVINVLECIGGPKTPVGAIGLDLDCTGQGSPVSIENVSIVPIVSNPVTTAIHIKNGSFTLKDLHVEQATQAIDVDACNVMHIQNINAGPNVTNVVNWRANNTGNSLVVLGVNSGGTGFTGFAVVDGVNGINAGPPGLTLGAYIVGTGSAGQQPIYTSDNAVTMRLGSTKALADLARSFQSIAYAAAITPNAAAGEIVSVGALTGNITINAPTNPRQGQFLTFYLLQDGVGGRTITWNGVFSLPGGVGTSGANTRLVFTFFYDGAAWQWVGGGIFDNSGQSVFPAGTYTAGNAFFAAAMIAAKDFRRSRQTPTEAVLVSGVDATAGELVAVTLTAARLVGAPLNPIVGQRLVFVLVQGGAGAFAVTWNAAFKGITGGTSGATGTQASFAFNYDGTNWRFEGAQPTWVA
jgi:hypothetical protein